MKLTHRQETFFLRLLDLCRETNGPIHYSTLAEKVGVSPFTAYDMLRLLEEKGFVTSEYRVEPGRANVGRSEILFLPTQLTYDRFSELNIGADQSNWEEARNQILERIRADDVYDRTLAEELLARIPPDAPETLRYCSEVMTFLIMRLEKTPGRQLLVDRIPQIRDAQNLIPKSGLLLLGGFVLGLLAMENGPLVDGEHSILEHVQRYQTLVMDMEPRLCKRLAASLNEILTLVLQT
ncbi:MAG TPA: Lrp/AsnC family transcriptional regulator [Anaerolineaceae bacterium]|nr:Lrp/AsnC family transcriptional regulator [Anaerolineaceae bacterium]HOV06133.1 Lrp/AsnC family transcriptional regulator [Anaerolineaceae bacterium]